VVKIYLQPGASLDTANAQVVAVGQYSLRNLPPSIQLPEIEASFRFIFETLFAIESEQFLESSHKMAARLSYGRWQDVRLMRIGITWYFT